MWASLSKFAPLPGDTRVYCAHEYTESNARFAVHVDAGNEGEAAGVGLGGMGWGGRRGVLSRQEVRARRQVAPRVPGDTVGAPRPACSFTPPSMRVPCARLSDLKRMHADITAKRARQEPTVPSVLDDERKCNPFLRPGVCWVGRRGSQRQRLWWGDARAVPRRLWARLRCAQAALPRQPLSALTPFSVSPPAPPMGRPRPRFPAPADSPAIRAALGVPADASNDVAFGAIRAAKDTFR